MLSRRTLLAPLGVSLAAALVACGGASTESATSDKPSAPAAATVSVVAPVTSLYEGQSSGWSATVRDATGAVLSVAVMWSAADTTVASVSSAGVVTAKRSGSTQIQAAVGAVVGSASVTVLRVPVSSVTIAPDSGTLFVGQQLSLAASVRDSAGATLAGRTVTWASANDNVATVTGAGVVTGVAAGQATITATAEGKQAAAVVTVRQTSVASIAVTPAAPTLNVGDVVQLAAVAKDSAGTALSGLAVAYTSSNTAVATVSSSGVVTGVTQGVATISAASEGRSATASVTVANSVPGLLPHYTLGDSIGSIKVFSDISAAFTHEHAVNLDKTWRYYATFFGATPGTHFEMYYTLDSATYVATFKYCPAVYYQNARQVNGCWNVYGDGAWIEFVIPYVTPDYGTQYHEVSHLFLQRVHPDAENYPWLKEGSGMYFESGSFDASGNLVITTPLPYITQGFHQYDQAGQLIPLATLLFENRTDFYAGLNGGNGVREYAQSGLFFTFLMKSFPAVMTALFDSFKQSGTPTNTDVVNFVTAGTGRTVSQLEAEYIAYGRSLP